MNFNEFLAWLTGYLKKNDPKAEKTGFSFRSDMAMGENTFSMEEAAAILESGQQLHISLKGEEAPYLIVDPKLVTERMRLIGAFEGDPKYDEPGTPFAYKEGYKGIKKFSDNEKFNMLFDAQLKKYHDKAIEILEQDVRRKAIETQLPRPKEASYEIFTRGYRYQLDISGTEEAERNNFRLQETLNSDAGRKYFLGNIIRNVLTSDFKDIIQKRSFSDNLKYYDEHQAQLDLLFIAPNILDAFKRVDGPKLDEPLFSILKDFNLIAQGAGFYKGQQEAIELDEYYMLSGITSLEEAVKTMSGGVPDAVAQSGGRFATYYYGSGEGAEKDAKDIEALGKIGALSLYAKLTDENNNPITRQQAIELLGKNKTVNVTEMSADEKKALDDQLANPFHVDMKEIEKSNEIADKRYQDYKNQKAIDAHDEELKSLGVVGELRRELEFQQLKLGQTSAVESPEYYTELVARVIAISQIISQVEGIQNQYPDMPEDELKGIIDTLADSEQIFANANSLMESETFKTFMTESSPELLESLAIKELEDGSLTPYNYETIRGISDNLSEKYSKEYSDAYVRKQAEELNDAKEWYKSLGEALTAQGIDLNNPYSMGLLRIYEPPKPGWDNIDELNRDPKEVRDIIVGMGEGSYYAFMERQGGKYKVAPPADDNQRPDWIKNNLQTYANASDEVIMSLYRNAQQNRLMLRSREVATEWQSPPSLIAIGKDGKASVTPPIPEFDDTVEHPEKTEEVRAKYGFSDKQIKEICKMSSYITGGKMYKDGVIDTIKRNPKPNETTEEKELRKELCVQMSSAVTKIDAEKLFVVTAIKDPSWIANPKVAENFYRGYKAALTDPDFRRPEENKFLESFRIPGKTTFEVSSDVLKITGAKSLDELMKSNIIHRLNGEKYTDNDTMKFLFEVEADCQSKAVVLDIQNPETKKIERFPYVKFDDWGFVKAVEVKGYKNELAGVKLYKPEKASPEFDALTDSLSSAMGEIKATTNRNRTYARKGAMVTNFEKLSKSAEEYRKSLAKKENLSATELANLKAVANLDYVCTAGVRGEAIIKNDPLRNLAVKLACEQCEQYLSGKGEIPQSFKSPKEFGMAVLTNKDLMTKCVDNVMQNEAFQKCFGKMNKETLTQLMKIDIKDIYEGYAGVLKAFAAEKSAAQSVKEGNDLKNEVQSIGMGPVKS